MKKESACVLLFCVSVNAGVKGLIRPRLGCIVRGLAFCKFLDLAHLAHSFEGMSDLSIPSAVMPLRRLRWCDKLIALLSMRTGSMAVLLLSVAELGLAVEPPAKSDCEDPVGSVATIVPKLDSPLYRETKASLNWWIVESESGVLEDTTDGEIGPDDLVRIEHTANCTSTHQGEHLMEFCDAVREGDRIHLSLSGGMPAYDSSLSVTIDSDLKFRCSFSATGPAPANVTRWKITKKELRLRSRDFTPGHRLFGWISITFEELADADGQPKSYKIEGYIKPVIQHKGG